jgi:Leucine-rich repeat (LRR) protein
MIKAQMGVSQMNSNFCSGLTVGSDGKLDLQKKSLDTFSTSDITRPADVVELNLSNNPLKTVPDLSALTSLKVLKLCGTKLSEIPAEMGTWCASVDTLELRDNSITNPKPLASKSSLCFFFSIFFSIIFQKKKRTTTLL